MCVPVPEGHGMNEKRKIVIWDTDARRAAEISRNLGLAMRATGVRRDLEIMSEPPLVARTGLNGRLPALEADGMFWTWKVGEGIPEEAAAALLRRLEESAGQEAGKRENGA